VPVVIVMATSPLKEKVNKFPGAFALLLLIFMRRWAIWQMTGL
jgi:hypothetical protein